MGGGKNQRHNPGEQLQLKCSREETARDVGEDTGRNRVVTESK